MRLNKKQTIILVGIFLLMVVTIILQTVNVYRKDVNAERERATLNAKYYSEALQQDLQRGIAISDTLEAMLIDNGGRINNFEKVAEHLMEDYIGSIQLAPKGVVDRIYPLRGNEAGMIDLMNDAQRGPVLEYSKKNDVVTMQGPFDLMQGGQGLAIRNPIYLGESKKADFWGFSIVIIKVPAIYEHSLKSLKAFGYDYCVDTTVSPISKESVRVNATIGEGESLSDPASYDFHIGKCDWSLNVQPQRGWSTGKAIPVALGGGVFAILITLMTYLLLGLYEQHRNLKELAEHDQLTGVYSRRALMDVINKSIQEKPKETMTAVFLDLDDFKLINDLHGHMAGDEALRTLTRNLESGFPIDAMIGRTGGDEFCVLLRGRSPEECSALIHQALNQEQKFCVGSKEYSFSISAGYADYPSQAQDREHLLTLADQALYASKIAGKNRFLHYEANMSDIKRSRLGFSVKNIADGIPGSFLIYKADIEEEILFANDELIEMFGFDNFQDFLDHTQGSFQHFVHPDDIDRVERAVREQITSQKRSSGKTQKHYDDYVEYRVITKDGEARDVVDLGRLIHTEHYGDIFFVFIRDKETFRV